MEVEYDGQRKSKLTWGAGLNSQLVPPTKKSKSKFQPIPVDENIYVRNKDGYVIGHSSQYENPIYVRDFITRKNNRLKEGEPEWSSRIADLDGDGRDDMVIYQGENPMVWNGYHYVRNAPMLEREEFMQNPENEAKYGYSIKKYRFDQKSPFEKTLHSVAKNIYDNLKTLDDPQERQIVLADLTTNFLKTWIKQAIIIPQLIKTGLIRGITIKQYYDELMKLATIKKNNPDFKYGKAVDLMALFKLASKILDSLPPRDVDGLYGQVSKPDTNTIYESYKVIGPFSQSAGRKILFIASWVKMIYSKQAPQA